MIALDMPLQFNAMNFRPTTTCCAATECQFFLWKGLRGALNVMLVPSLKEEQGERQMLP